jgi:hypothetical protein
MSKCKNVNITTNLDSLFQPSETTLRLRIQWREITADMAREPGLEMKSMKIIKLLQLHDKNLTNEELFLIDE